VEIVGGYFCNIIIKTSRKIIQLDSVNLFLIYRYNPF
jgi:hypothetical protein